MLFKTRSGNSSEHPSCVKKPPFMLILTSVQPIMFCIPSSLSDALAAPRSAWPVCPPMVTNFVSVSLITTIVPCVRGRHVFSGNSCASSSSWRPSRSTGHHVIPGSFSDCTEHCREATALLVSAQSKIRSTRLLNCSRRGVTPFRRDNDCDPFICCGCD